MRFRVVAFSSLVAAGVVCSRAAAEPKIDVPLEMTADGGLIFDLVRRIGRAEGNVIVRRHDMVVCCDRAEAKLKNARIDSVRCEGDAVIRRLDGTRITADHVQYDAAHNLLTLTGRVVAQRADGELAGAKMVYRLDQDRLEVTGPRSTLRFIPAPTRALHDQRSREDRIEVKPRRRPECPAPSGRRP